MCESVKPNRNAPMRMKTIRNCHKKTTLDGSTHMTSLIRPTANPLNAQWRRLTRYEHIVRQVRSWSACSNQLAKSSPGPSSRSMRWCSFSAEVFGKQLRFRYWQFDQTLDQPHHSIEWIMELRKFLRFRCKSTRRKGELDSTNTDQRCIGPE